MEVGAVETEQQERSNGNGAMKARAVRAAVSAFVSPRNNVNQPCSDSGLAIGFSFAMILALHDDQLKKNEPSYASASECLQAST